MNRFNQLKLRHFWFSRFLVFESVGRKFESCRAYQSRRRCAPVQFCQ